jgi:predicted component of type VI protein secretion system
VFLDSKILSAAPPKIGHHLSERRKAKKMPDKQKSSYAGIIQVIQRKIRNFFVTASGGYVKFSTFFLTAVSKNQ